MDQQNNAAGGAGLMNKVKQGAVSQLNTQKDRATSGIGSVASAVRQTMQPLRDSQQETMAHYVEQAAGQLDRFSNALKQKDVNELLGDAQRFARRNPAIFIGSAFAIGLVAARFFKSSSDRDTYGNYGRDWRRGEGGESMGGYRSSGSMYEGGYGRGAGMSPVGTSGIGTAGTSGTGSDFGGSADLTGSRGTTSDIGSSGYGTTGAGTQGGGASGTGTSGLGTSGTATSRGEWGNDSGRS